MDEFLSRAQLLLGEEAITRLANAKVAVFGIGGVGGYCVEALARGGIGSLSLYDPDRIGKSNLNRQIIATQRTLGEYKVNAMKSRIIEINPDAEVQAIPLFFETVSYTHLDVYKRQSPDRPIRARCTPLKYSSPTASQRRNAENMAGCPVNRAEETPK